MTFLPLALLALIQGITEFIPVSSQAHLILLPEFFGWDAHDRVLDAAVHFGTLGAVCVYFWKDLVNLFAGFFRMMFSRTMNDHGKMALFLVIATLPSVFFGFLIQKYTGNALRGIAIIGWMSLIFGLILYLIDRFCKNDSSLKEMSFGKAFLVGCAQVFAFLPGASRSGTTISALRFFGFTRIESIRFSFLMSIPVVLGAVTLTVLESIGTENDLLSVPFLSAIVISFLAGLCTISFMMHWLKHHSFAPFMIYRILLGIGIIFWVSY
ncbi:MAG: undecaprenyl-diphosphate phosphatase [Alphaproteobacteria bacterium]|jgi:undecaprenyl-diphosphatase|nr:undecaprenyl-diphosphate phosphatase [Alphaproteobacteria bacterium]MBT5389160.1 undecaprenyl-diphosphate phosphatase [Alphaproteobacteria bacterium]MBT5540207.1 undecaprenyl-diphosphate phosphatase [Alphaproteobacteria bacterium]